MTMNLTLRKQDSANRKHNKTNKLQRQIEACSDVELERIEASLSQKAQAGAERKTVKLLQYCCSLRRTGRAFSGDEAMMFVYDAAYSRTSTGQLRRLMTYLSKTIAALHSDTPPNPQDFQLEAETLMNKALYADAVKTLRRWLKAAEEEERLSVIPEIYRKLIRCHVARLDDKPLDDLLAALHHAQMQADFHAAFHNTLAKFIALKAQKKTIEIQSCLKTMRDLSGKLHHCDYARVMTAMLCGNHLLHTDDAAAAKSHYEAALEIVKSSRSAEVDADVRFKLDVNLAGAYSVLGQYGAALERYRSVLRSPYSRHNFTVLENASLAAMMAENYVDAENFARRAIVIAEQTENQSGAAKSYLTLAQCQVITSAYSVAMTSLEKAERIAKHK
ncbi:MAG: hypothetical protein IAF08_08595 [Rhizobacter sp.]|nr:hypothetical protein [Chlorobiales bacterium]